MASNNEASPAKTPVLSMLSYVAMSKDDRKGTTYHIPQSALELLGVQAPPRAVMALFGLGGAREGLGSIYPILQKQGLLCRPVRITADIAFEPHIRIGLVKGDALLDDTNFLHLSRIRADLRALIKSLWIDICIERGLPNDQVEAGFPTKPTAHPEWIGDLLADPRLKHIQMIAFPVSVGDEMLPVVAAFRPSKLHVMLDEKFEGKIKLPSLK